MPLPSFSEDAGLDDDDEIEENYSEMRAQVQADSQRDDDEPEEETLQQQLAALRKRAAEERKSRGPAAIAPHTELPERGWNAMRRLMSRAASLRPQPRGCCVGAPARSPRAAMH